MSEERYELHNWVSKNIFVKNKEKGISQLVSETILSLRTYLINKKVDELKDEIKIENNNDKILEEINEYHKLKSLLSKKLNRVFLTIFKVFWNFKNRNRVHFVGILTIKFY